MLKLFFVGMLFVSTFYSASALLAKEDGTEECDAVAHELELDHPKKVVDRLVGKNDNELVKLVQGHEQSLIQSKKEYDEAMNHYGGQTANIK